MDLTNVSSNMQFIGQVYNLEILAMLIPFLMALLLWELVWKGFALWRAARLGMTPWFITMLVVNSVGILPITFLLMTRKKYRDFQRKSDHEEIVAIAEEVMESHVTHHE